MPEETKQSQEQKPVGPTFGPNQPAGLVPKWEDILKKDGFYVQLKAPDTNAGDANFYGMAFVAALPCELIAVAEVHSVGAAPGSLIVQKYAYNQDTLSYSNVNIVNIPLDLGARTPQIKLGTDLASTRDAAGNPATVFAPLDFLFVDSTGDIAATDDLILTFYFKPFNRGDYSVPSGQ